MMSGVWDWTEGYKGHNDKEICLYIRHNFRGTDGQRDRRTEGQRDRGTKG